MVVTEAGRGVVGSLCEPFFPFSVPNPISSVSIIIIITVIFSLQRVSLTKTGREDEFSSLESLHEGVWQPVPLVGQ